MHALVTAHSHRISAADGTLLYVSDFLLPLSEARGSVVMMHGLGEHSGRQRPLARFFNECGLSVRCYDARGHGRSAGDRGDVINGDPMVQDAEIIIDDFSAHFSKPPFLFGHSMGGLFAARFALAQLSPLRGLILSSPALALRLSRLDQVLLKGLETVAPWLGVPNGVSPKLLSHDPAVVATYKADPLVHGRISARLLRSMLASIEYCHAHAAGLSVPALLLVAGEDRIVDKSGSERLFRQCPDGQASLHVYDGFYHEVFNELESARPLADLRAWMMSHSACASG